MNHRARTHLPIAIKRISLFCSFIAVVGAFNLSSNVSAAAPPTKPPAKPAGANYSSALNSYWQRLQPRILNNWSTPDGKNHVVLTATIQQDGSVADVTVVSNPSNNLADQSCTEAFNKSQPLEALPQGLSAAKLTITFDYNYDPHGDGSSKVYGMIAPSQVAQASEAPADGAPGDSK